MYFEDECISGSDSVIRWWYFIKESKWEDKNNLVATLNISLLFDLHCFCVCPRQQEDEMQQANSRSVRHSQEIWISSASSPSSDSIELFSYCLAACPFHLLSNGHTGCCVVPGQTLKLILFSKGQLIMSCKSLGHKICPLIWKQLRRTLWSTVKILINNCITGSHPVSIKSIMVNPQLPVTPISVIPVNHILGDIDFLASLSLWWFHVYVVMAEKL